MVKILNQQDHEALQQALDEARRKTCAHIDITVLPESDGYASYIMLYAFGLASLIALALWQALPGLSFPLLLTIQLGIAALIDLTHGFGRLFMCLVPEKIRHAHARHAAHHAFAKTQAHQKPNAPFVLLFVSVAERYVHVMTSHTVHQTMPGQWDKVIGDFTHNMRTQGLRPSCIEAIAAIAGRLSAVFPAA